MSRMKDYGKNCPLAAKPHPNHALKNSPQPVIPISWPLFSGHFKALRINHSKLFAEGRNHINGIENFWENFENWENTHRRKFNGIPKAHSALYLQECEWHLTILTKASIIAIKAGLTKNMHELFKTAHIFISWMHHRIIYVLDQKQQASS